MWRLTNGKRHLLGASDIAERRDLAPFEAPGPQRN
jgi:hypothetical protein